MSRIKDTHALKQLQSQKAKLEVQLEEQNGIKMEAGNQANNIKQRIGGLNTQINELKQKSKDPVVTEHALLRYFEHVLGYNLDDMRAVILGDGRSDAISAMGSGKLPIIDGHKLVVKDRAVVSIAHKDY